MIKSGLDCEASVLDDLMGGAEEAVNDPLRIEANAGSELVFDQLVP